MTPAMETQLYLAWQPTSRERDFQLVTARYLNALEDAGLLAWFHPANERKCSPQAGRWLKLAGVKAGVADCVIYSHRLAIELKTEGGVATQAQKDFALCAFRWLWDYVLARNPDEVVGALRMAGVKI